MTLNVIIVTYALRFLHKHLVVSYPTVYSRCSKCIVSLGYIFWGYMGVRKDFIQPK